MAWTPRKVTARVATVTVVSLFACSGAVAPASADAPLVQGFEDGAPFWTKSGLWRAQARPQALAVAPAIAALVTLEGGTALPAAPQGASVAWFGEPATGTYCGADFASVRQTSHNGCTSTRRQAGALTSPPFSLAQVDRAVLVFRAWWEIEAVQADVADLMRVEYSLDRGNVWLTARRLNPVDPAWGGRHQVLTDAGARESGGWRSYSAELPGAEGRSGVSVRFVFDTVDRLRNGFRGLLVDDVRVVDDAGRTLFAPDGGPFTDLPPQLAVEDARLDERSEGGWHVDFTIRSTYALPRGAGARWKLYGRTREQVEGAAELLPGATTTAVSVPVSGDDAPYTIELASARDAAIDPARAVVSTAPRDLVAQFVLGARAAALRPLRGRTFVATHESGVIRYRRPGSAVVTLRAGSVLLPFGSVLDTTDGRVGITVESDRAGTLQEGDFWDGRFGVFQNAGDLPYTDLHMAGGDFSGCAAAARRGRSRRAASTPIRRLWGSARGRFRTRGRFATAAVRGTRWRTEDVCLATHVSVDEGSVSVFDFRRRTTRVVRAGESVTVAPLQSARYRHRRGIHPPRLARQ